MEPLYKAIYRLLKIYIVFIIVGMIYCWICSEPNKEYWWGAVLVLWCCIYAPRNTIFVLLLYFSRINQTIIKNIWVLLFECISVIILPDILSFLRDHYTTTKFVTVDGHSFPDYKWYLTDYAFYFEAYIIIFIVFVGIKLVRMWAKPTHRSNLL